MIGYSLEQYLGEFSSGWLPPSALEGTAKIWRGVSHLERTGHERKANKHGQCSVCVKAVEKERLLERNRALLPGLIADGPTAMWSTRQERIDLTHLRRTGHKRVQGKGGNCVLCSKERNASWQRENRERRREKDRLRDRTQYAARRRERLLASGTHTVEDLATQMKAQRGRCYWCGKPTRKNYHVEHVIPLARGGSNTRENIVIACPDCNLSKWNKLPEEFAGRLL